MAIAFLGFLRYSTFYIFLIGLIIFSRYAMTLSVPDHSELHYLHAWMIAYSSTALYATASFVNTFCNVPIIFLSGHNTQRGKRARFYVAMSLLFPIALYTAASLSLSTILPPSIDACNHPEQWPHIEGLKEVFQMIGASDIDSQTPDEGCQSLKVMWYWGLAILGASLLSCLILLCFATFPPSIIGTAIFCHQWLSRILQRHQQSKANINIAMNPLKRRQVAKPVIQPPATQLLSNDRIRRAIARHLHYNDILNLSLTSHGTHVAIFDPSCRSESIETLHLASCQPGTKASCWSCGNQVCATCTVTREIGSPTSAHHLHNCAPYCSGCYYRCLWSRAAQDKEPHDRAHAHMHQKKPHGANPRPALAKLNPRRRLRWLRSIPWISSLPEPPPPSTVTSEDSEILVQRSLCQHCASQDASVAITALERRERAEMRSLAHRLRCEGCLRDLSSVRNDGMGKYLLCWWFCRACFEPCWWDGHGSFDGGREDEKDDWVEEDSVCGMV